MPNLDKFEGPGQYVDPKFGEDLDKYLYAREAEIKNLEDLTDQRGTPIPALFNQFYKFVQNPSVISVETFKRMVDTDDTIGSGVDFLTTCLSARMGAYQHKSPEITEWVNRWLENLENGGWEESLKEILSATWAGFSATEVKWKDDDELGWVPQKLVTMPPGTILFETERTGELTKDGILQYQRNYNPFLLGRGLGYFGNMGAGLGSAGGLNGQPDSLAKYGDLPFPLRTANTFNYLSVRIPIAKCIHYAFNAQGKFGNPYGRSLLRRVYKWWVTKDNVLRMMTIALDRKGTPLTLVYSDPNTTLEDPDANPSGNNPKGVKQKGIRADQAAKKAFTNVHNDSVIFLPGKEGEIYKATTLSQQSNANDFLEVLRFCNMSIMRGLLIPSLIFNGGDGNGSYSLGQEHAQTFDKLLDSMNASAENVIINQLIARAIRLNFPESAYRKDGYGSFAKRELSQEEIGKEMDVIEKAVNIGAIDMNELTDLNNIREKIKFEPRDTIIEPPVTTFDPNGEQTFAPEGTFGEDHGSGGKKSKAK